MSKFVIVTDSSCDMSDVMAKELELTAVPLSVNIDGDIYNNYLDEREITLKEFYEKRIGAKTLKTSAPNHALFIEMVEPLIQAGNDVLYIGFTSGLSATYSVGANAMDELAEKYPERTITHIDSNCAAGGEGLILYKAVQLKRNGASIEEIKQYIEKNRRNVCHWFTVNDLMHLKRGGRVSATTAIVGSVLNVKPVLHVDNDGKLVSMYTARGRKASIKALLKEMLDRNIEGKNSTVFINHAWCEDEANQLADMIRSEIGTDDIHIWPLGPVIGSHTGLGCIALFFMGSER